MHACMHSAAGPFDNGAPAAALGPSVDADMHVMHACDACMHVLRNTRTHGGDLWLAASAHLQQRASREQAESKQ